jgi:hypothetical protein
MSRGKDFSASDYQRYWKLTPEERSQNQLYLLIYDIEQEVIERWHP